MHISHKTLVYHITLLVAAFTFILVSECNAQRGFRLPRRQQQIENRVRQVTPQTAPAENQQPAPAAEKKEEASPAPAVTEKAEPAPAPAEEKKAEETPAPAVKEKAKKTTSKKKAKETPAPTVKEKDEENPNAETSIIKEETNVPEAPAKEKADSENAAPDLDELLSEDSDEALSDPDPLHQEAVEKVLANPNVPEEAKTALKQATKEDIQKSVREATAEVEADNKNEHIDGVVEKSRKEVDEDSIETAVNEVLDSTEETLQAEQERSETPNAEEVVDDSVPDSVNQVIQNLKAENKEKTEDFPAVDDSEDDDEETGDDEDDEDADEDEDDAEEDADEDEVDAEDETMDAGETDAETADGAKEAEASSEAKLVKLDDLDQELKIPENATFEQLHAFLTGLDSLIPSDLEQTNQDVQMQQVKTFIEKVAQAKLAASDQMLALEGLTDEQWKEAVSWKVQSLARLFQLDGSKIGEMRKFVEEIRPKAPQDTMWTIESILIQMELAQEEPTPEELKAYVNRMLAHTQKGIDENCVSLDFVLATVQMVVLTEDSLPKEESKEVFESAIKTLNSSETPKFKEIAKFLQKILDQREIVGKSPDLTLETYDGKTVKTADFVGKTLLIYCFQMSSRDQLQDLGLVYQIYLVFHERGLEVLGIVPEEKTDAMDELLKQIPWPMVFEGEDAKNSTIEKLCVPTLPTKVLVNAEGKIENANIQPMELLKYLEAVYGPVTSPSKDGEKAEASDDAEEKAETEKETDALDPPADDADETADPEAEDAEESEDAEDAEDAEEAAAEAEKAPAEEAKEKGAEKAEEKGDSLDLDLDSLL